MTNAEDWQPLLDDLGVRRVAAAAMGGDERLARHREAGRLDARARVGYLLDDDSFREIGAHAGSVGRGMTPVAPADGLVAGHGMIDGRPVLVGAEDFTVMGGSIGIATHAKRYRLAQLARQERVPLVMLLEGAGERAQNAFERYPHAPNDLQALVRLRGVVPTVAVVMGASAGHGALTAPLMDLTIMVEGAALFTAGPPLVAAATGEEVSKEALGGAAIHTTVSGVAQNSVPDDEAALDLVRTYLSYFPSNAAIAPPRRRATDGRRTIEAMLDVVPPDPRRPYDIRKVVELTVDDGNWLEVQPGFGRSLVTGLARLAGRAVAIVANNPAVKAGAIDCEAAEKAARFLEVVGPFGLPIVFLADNPGVLAGTRAEQSGILRHAARMYAAQAGVSGPKLHVTLRKAYGFGSSLMAMNPFDAQTTTLAFPGARLGAMPAESGADAAGIEPDVRALLEHAELGGAYAAADRLSYDDVIDPRALRNELLGALELTSARSARRTDRGATGPDGGAAR
ncbi:MAG: carboxyl transferase domain-containing protein [Acidimicrobiia bacterium]